MTQALDTVDVLRRDDTPAHFLWRGRLYAVRQVLDHWSEDGEGVAHSGASAAACHRAALADPDAREVWRVRAAAGRLAEPGVFELCFAWSRAQWTLSLAPQALSGNPSGDPSGHQEVLHGTAQPAR